MFTRPSNKLKNNADQTNLITVHSEPVETRPDLEAILKKFQGKNEKKLPSLDQAFRRAAAFGTPEDLDNLLFYGANIDSCDEKKKQTALHQAVQYLNFENAKHLLAKNADSSLEDFASHTAAYYASTAKSLKIRGLFAEKGHAIFKDINIFKQVINFLPVLKIAKFTTVSSTWNEFLTDIKDSNSKTIFDNTQNKEIFEKLPKYLQKIIKKQLFKKSNIALIERLFLLFPLSYEQRRDNVFPDDQYLIADREITKGFVLSDTGLTLYVLNLLADEEIFNKADIWSTQYGAFLLTEELLTKQQIKNFKFSNSPTGSQDNLKDLATKNGVIALKEKLLKPEQIPYISQLSTLLSDFGIRALQEKLITPEQANQIHHSGSSRGLLRNLLILISENGLIALREKLITPEQTAYISDLGALLSDFGIQALREKLITAEQAKQIYHSGSSRGPFGNLPILMSKNGLIALREKLITPEQAAYISSLSVLLSDFVIQALQEKLITAEQVKEIHNFGSSPGRINNLSALMSKNGLIALREKFITPEQAAHISDLNALLSDFGIQALREKLITIEQAKLVYHSGPMPGLFRNLPALMSKNGLIALREKFITLEQARYISNLNALLSDFGIQALREKLITPEQAKQIYHSGSVNGPYDNLPALMSKNGLILLREKFITLEQAAYIFNINLLIHDEVIALFKKGLLSLSSEKYIGVKIRSASNLISVLPTLCTASVKTALLEKLITQEQLEKIKNPAALLTDLGLYALKNKLISGEQASCIEDLASLLSPTGIKALEQNIITIEQAQQYKYLTILKLPNGLEAIKAGVINYQQAMLFEEFRTLSYAESLTTILSGIGRQALSEKLITVEQATKFYRNRSKIGAADLKDLLTPTGLMFLREKIITPEEANDIIDLNTLLNKSCSQYTVIALKNKLICLNDFKFKGKFYFANNYAQAIKNLVATWTEQQRKNEALTPACVVVQKHWRAKSARTRYGLFKDLKACMQTSNIHYLHEMVTAKHLIDQGKLKAAKDQVNSLKAKLLLK